jgi:hypothetical protein
MKMASNLKTFLGRGSHYSFMFIEKEGGEYD